MPTVYTDSRCPGLQIRWHGGMAFQVWILPLGQTDRQWKLVETFYSHTFAANSLAARQIAESHFGQMFETACDRLETVLGKLQTPGEFITDWERGNENTDMAT